MKLLVLTALAAAFFALANCGEQQRKASVISEDADDYLQLMSKLVGDHPMDTQTTRVLKLQFNNGTLASMRYVEGDEYGRQNALIYITGMKSKWTHEGGLEGLTIEDRPL